MAASYRQPGAAVVPGTFTTVLMYPETRLATQIEKRVCAYAKHLNPDPRPQALEEARRKLQGTDIVPVNIVVKRRDDTGSMNEDSEFAEEEESHTSSIQEDWRHKPCDIQVNRNALIDEVKSTLQSGEARAAAIQIKQQIGEKNAAEAKLIRRLQAKKQSKVKALRAEIAWAKVEEKEMQKEMERRALEAKWKGKTEQLRIRELKNDERIRRAKQREKDARTKMHEFYPLLQKAKKTGEYTDLMRHLEDFMSQPRDVVKRRPLRPASAPSLRAGSRSPSQTSRLERQSSFGASRSRATSGVESPSGHSTSRITSSRMSRAGSSD